MKLTEKQAETLGILVANPYVRILYDPERAYCSWGHLNTWHSLANRGALCPVGICEFIISQHGRALLAEYRAKEAAK